MGGGWVIYFNETAAGFIQSEWTNTIAHELSHIAFPYRNRIQTLTWMKIRENSTSGGVNIYRLADELRQNNHCSAGVTHERHNPENVYVCGAEQY